MKFLIIGDLHGQMPKVHYKNFDAIIAPGDFCSSDETRKYMFQAIKMKFENPKSKIEWYDLVGKNNAKKMIQKSILDGRKILKNLNSYDVPVYVVPGNNDWTQDKSSKWDVLKKDYYNSLIKSLPNIRDIQHQMIDIGEYQMIGHGISSGPEYPQYKRDIKMLKSSELKKKKISYNQEFRKVSSLFEKVTKPTIFLTHDVPFNTSLDKIENPESPRNGDHFGSLIARKMIDKYQPLVCIGGHMHEHFGKCKLQKTTCINAGYGPKVNILMELDENKISKLRFYK